VAIPTNTTATTAPPNPVLRTNRGAQDSVAAEASAARLVQNRTEVEKLQRQKEEVLQSQIDEVAVSALPRKGKLSLQLASRAAGGALRNASAGTSSTAKLLESTAASTAPSPSKVVPATTTAAAEPKTSRPSAAPSNTTTAAERRSSRPSAG
ncbi:unnamed protein product, partial [Symbiodinium sp. CCMP2456]